MCPPQVKSFILLSTCLLRKGAIHLQTSNTFSAEFWWFAIWVVRSVFVAVWSECYRNWILEFVCVCLCVKNIEVKHQDIFMWPFYFPYTLSKTCIQYNSRDDCASHYCVYSIVYEKMKGFQHFYNGQWLSSSNVVSWDSRRRIQVKHLWNSPFTKLKVKMDRISKWQLFKSQQL